MLIPCIDLQSGRVVQLEHGRRMKLAIDDVLAVAERFRSYPLLHVVDLDAAMRRGSNGRLVRQICRWSRHSHGPRIRVGGGIRTVRHTRQILGWGADQVIIGSAAFRHASVNHAFLARLTDSVGRRRVILALDTDAGHIVVRGWRKKLALHPEEVIAALESYCSGFLCTFVDAEGTLQGTNLPWFRDLQRLTRRPIIAAGGISSAREVRSIERAGMQAAVGMAVYRGLLG